MELQTIENLDIIVNYQQALIEFDNAELIRLTTQTVGKYKDLVVTEDIVTDITKEVASLNKLFKKLDDKRKDIKKDYTKPLTVFEDKIKLATGMITDVVDKLKLQLQVFEDKRKDDVRLQIVEFIKEIVTEHNLLDKYASQMQIHDQYLNKTAKIKEVKDSLHQQAILLSQAQELEELKATQEMQRIEREKAEHAKQVAQRCELVNKLNLDYGLNFTYDKFVDFSDIEVIDFYNKTQEKEEPKVAIINKVEATISTDIKETPNYILQIRGLNLDEIKRITNGLDNKLPHAIYNTIKE
jgi:hypothetical protein